ncbi:MAG: hypothetical protein MHMPM18_003779 [Marteilia pararefringens]
MEAERYAFLDSLDVEVKQQYFEFKQRLDSLRSSTQLPQNYSASADDCDQWSKEACLEKCQGLFEAFESSLRRESEVKIESQVLESKVASSGIRIEQLSKITNSDSESHDFLKRVSQFILSIFFSCISIIE